MTVDSPTTRMRQPEKFLKSPRACALLLLIEHNQLSFDQVFDPWLSQVLLAKADELSIPFHENDPWLWELARRDSGRYVTMAKNLLAHPGLSSWTDRAPDRRELHTTIQTGKRIDPRKELHGNAIPLTAENIAEGAGDLHPWFSSYETSALMPNGPSPKLVFVAQTPPDHKLSSSHTRTVLKEKASHAATLPVVSISGVEDWQAFRHAFSSVSPSSGEPVPDWERARKELAGIHVSTLAVLTLDVATYPNAEYGMPDPTDPATDSRAHQDYEDLVLAEAQLAAFMLDVRNEIVLWFNPTRDLEIVEELPPIRGGRDIPRPQPKLEAPPELQSRVDRWERSTLLQLRASMGMGDYGPAVSARTPPPRF
ncbi:MAG: hypothetical protein ACR2OU_17935 [Thermomicrobiales bacterium]